MNIAIVGNDPAALPWVRALAATAKHRVTCATGVTNLSSALAQVVPPIPIEPRWQQLLTRSDVDAAIVCGTEPAALEIAKQIAAAGKPLIILPRSGQGSTWIYELGLIRDEIHTPILPGLIDRLSPPIAAIRRELEAGHLGRLLYLQLERTLPVAADGMRLLDRESVDDALLNDVDLLRLLGGDYSRVNAVDSGISDDRVSIGTVTLSGDGLPEATWSVRADDVDPAWRLKVAGERAEIIAVAVGAPSTWEIDRSPSAEQTESHDPIACIGEILDRLAGVPVRERPHVTVAGWNDLVRAFELVDGTRRSLRRRRAIDLHFESTSERSQFKSQMTAIGCLVLVFTFFAVLFLLIAMPLLDTRSRNQVEAERANSVFHDADFEPAQAALTPPAEERLRQLAQRMSGERFPIWIENSKPGAVNLDMQREELVAEFLRGRGVLDARQRIHVGRLVGEWYRPLWQVLRIAAFAPLFLFLAAQLLLRLAKPGSDSEEIAEN